MDGRTFTLEILEGLAVSRVEELNRQIRRLKEKGFRISIHHPDGRIVTVAEGVETEEDHLMIRSLGCDYGQGYYYSPPVSAEEFNRSLI